MCIELLPTAAYLASLLGTHLRTCVVPLQVTELTNESCGLESCCAEVEASDILPPTTAAQVQESSGDRQLGPTGPDEVDKHLSASVVWVSADAARYLSNPTRQRQCWSAVQCRS